MLLPQASSASLLVLELKKVWEAVQLSVERRKEGTNKGRKEGRTEEKGKDGSQTGRKVRGEEINED